MDNTQLNKMFEFLDSKTDEMERMLQEMAEIESPSSYKEGVNQVCAYIDNFCRKIGMSTQIFFYEHAGNSFTAVFNEKSPKKSIALMGHMDTVHPLESWKKPIVRKDQEYMYGPGVYDCKGGLVIAMYTCMALMKYGYKDRPIRLLFSGDEEVGHRQSEGAEIFTMYADSMAAALNCESGLLDGRVVTGRKGGIGMKMIVEGVASHSGNAPEKGRSAIREAAYKVIEIEKHTDYANTTYSCGLINGGTVANQIPDRCEITVDIRVKNQKAVEEACNIMEEIANRVYVEGTRTTLIMPKHVFTPMEETIQGMRLFEQYAEAGKYVGAIEAMSYFSGGGSDAAITSGAGVPSLCALGIRGADNHTKQERALLASLPERAKILAAMIVNFKEVS